MAAGAPRFTEAVLMCHAPIVIPAISRKHSSSACAATIRGMELVAESVVASKPDGIILLSPHTLRYRSSYGVVEGPEIFGTFESFGHPNISCSFASDRQVQAKLLSMAQHYHISLKHIPSEPLDHGALVPLYFLMTAGYRGKVIVLGFPYCTTTRDNCLFGKMLAHFASNESERWSLLASGDMSHRLTPSAPAGYNVNGAKFDRLVVDFVGTGRYEEISNIDPAVREAAAEDVVNSLEVATAAIGLDRNGRRLVSYECPFGVGYLTAILAGSCSRSELRSELDYT